jgi:hypothetical protein
MPCKFVRAFFASIVETVGRQESRFQGISVRMTSSRSPATSFPPPWAYALIKIDRGNDKAVNGKRPVQTYAFPEPGLFLSNTDEERGVLYLDN